MLSANNLPQYAVLFVDDEAEAREALAEALAGQMWLLTADSVNGALEVLEQYGDVIGVLLTDQRMPGCEGVDLLALVRRHWPGIVRIMTTAYSDYDDAIAAVNQGEILRYIHKPWNIKELRVELAHAMELHVLLREREQLLAEKLSVWQRMLEAGRARDLLVLASGIPWLRNAVPAASAFVLQLHGATRSIDWNRLDYSYVMARESERSIAVASALRGILETVERDAPVETSLAEVVGKAVQQFGAPVKVQDLSRLPPLRWPLAASARLLEWLLQEAQVVAAGKILIIENQLRGEDELQVVVDCLGERNFPTLLNSVEEDVASAPCHCRLLAAHLLAGYLGGTLVAEYHNDLRPVFLLRLPLAGGEERTLDGEGVDKVFALFES